VMDSTSLSGVVVTRADGTLAGDLCTSDLSYFLKYHVPLSLPVLKYTRRGVEERLKAAERREEEGGKEPVTSWEDRLMQHRPLVACMEDDPLHKVKP
jgi:hypothetical protein